MPPSSARPGSDRKPLSGQGRWFAATSSPGRTAFWATAANTRHSLLLDRVQTAHFNYVGDSILGNRSHLGAGAICSNLRLDRQPIVVRGPEGNLETGLRKFGAIVGDQAEVGCNAVLNPGTLLGPAFAGDAGHGLWRLSAARDHRQGALGSLARPAQELIMRTLTGITPSGTVHIGNYFGAMRPAIEAQEHGECFFFVADYHSMTAVFDPAERRRNTLEVALDWLACGLDPKKSVFWRQSDVPEVCELTWILGTLTPMGLLERAHSYKDKTAKGISPNFGLFAYPVLMAADILLYDTNVVPVGQDQKQHLEMTRDIAIKFNQTYGETFVVPEAQIREDVAVVPGLDGKKMSKSYGNTLEFSGRKKRCGNG